MTGIEVVTAKENTALPFIITNRPYVIGEIFHCPFYQECIIERKRRVSHSVYALYAIPGNGSRPFVGVSIQALNRKRVLDSH